MAISNLVDGSDHFKYTLCWTIKDNKSNTKVANIQPCPRVFINNNFFWPFVKNKIMTLVIAGFFFFFLQTALNPVTEHFKLPFITYE